MGGHEVDATERVLGDLIAHSHLTLPDRLPELVAEQAARIGATGVEVLLVDHAQRALVPLTAPGADAGEALGVDATIPGRAFRLVELQEVAGEDGRWRVWTPVIDGVDRLGVLGLTVAAVDEAVRDRARALAGLLAALIVSKSSVGDALVRTARRRPMTLAAEIQWAAVPPLTVGTEHLTISGMLEPAYEVGGDLIDYAVDAHRAHLAVFDAMGHGLQASLLAALTVGAYRNARRAGEGLEAIAAAIESAVAEQFPGGSFVTALLAELDVGDGTLRWINAGHPPPLLLRAGRVVKTLDPRPDRPLGAGLNAGLTVHAEQFEPGDRLLAYTDGVVEARDEHGAQFGAARLADFVVRADASGEPVPETMRRLSQALIAHQHGELQDDATHVLLEWRTDRGDRLVP